MTDFGYETHDDGAEVIDFTAGAGSGVGRLQKALAARVDVADELSEQKLAEIGTGVVREWRMDQESNKEWRKRAEDALSAAAQELPETKTYPWKGAANVRYPLLTIAGLQFAARAYPAIVKGDEAVKVKTFGKDTKGEKQKRAKRVAEYLNWQLFYKVDGWEADTDAMLHRLPSVGQHFRKVYYDPIEGRCCIESVSALRLTIPADAPSLRRSPRITHDFDKYPYELQRLMAAGAYRRVELDVPTNDGGTDDQASRVILEQHRMMDLDDDGLDEPYIVTVDASTEQVLRIEEAFDEQDVKTDESGGIVSITRWCPFVDYGFIPDPKGRAYSIGFGHLLTPIMDVVNTIINLSIDAGHAQVAGGGFIGSELRLQDAGKSGSLRFQPGEYKTVMGSGPDIKNSIVERTFPAPSAVLFQLLGMLMEAAKDIASVNDSITGDAARTAPVGTTLALIEQGQQVFNAIYKRIYRGLREEFKLFADCLSRYGDPAEYAKFCDDPAEAEMMGHNGGPALDEPQGGLMPPMAVQPQETDPAALFKADFDDDDLDIRPVSDPSAVTKLQSVAKSQFALSFVGQGMFEEDRAVVRQALLDAGIEQAETWIPEQQKENPLQAKVTELEIALKEAEVRAKGSTATLNESRAAEIAHRNSGAQADADLVSQSAKAQLDLATAAEKAAGLIPQPEQGPF